MKKTRNFILTLLCLCLITVCGFTASAASQPVITVSKQNANPGDTVTIDISISQNPGIMAMAFSVTYDSDSLSYEGHKNGYITSSTIKDHSDKGYVAIVNVESSDKSTNDKIISLTFVVKNDAKPGEHIITLANSNPQKYGNNLYNAFSNSKLDYIVPKIIAGSITVTETCENSEHKFGEWTVITPADCTNTGLKKRSCVRCELSEEKATPIAHDFEQEWTVDKAATPDEDGEMSRHCTKCDEVTDKITFSYEEIGGDDTSSDNSSSDVSSDSTSSDNVSSNESDTDKTNSSSDVENTSSSTSSETTSNQKPNINNQVGEKVPQQEAEKFENYQPPAKEDDVSSDNSDVDSPVISSPSVPEGLPEEDSNEVLDTEPDDADENLSDSNQKDSNNVWIFIVIGGVALIISATLGIFIFYKHKK